MALFNPKVALSLPLGILILVSSGPSQALDWPSKAPVQPFRCDYDGVFSQSGIQGSWAVSGQGEPAFSSVIRVQDVAMVTPLVRERIRNAEAIVQQVEITQKTTVEGPIVRERTHMVVALDGPKEGKEELRITVDEETICDGGDAPRTTGSRWICKHSLTDGWTLIRDGKVVDSGEDVVSTTERVRYLRDETFVLHESTEPVGDDLSVQERQVQAAVLEMIDDKDQVRRAWIDPNFPACPLRIERVAWNRVIGTDRLVRRWIDQQATGGLVQPQAADPDAKPSARNPWLFWIIGSTLGTLVGLWWVMRARRLQR